MTSVKELINNKSLIWNFALTGLKIRYRNSALGFTWTILEPLLLLAVIYLVISSILESDIEQFPLYLLMGLIMWEMFSRGTNMGLESIKSKESIMKQIYFPREIPAISASITSSLMLCFELIVFAFFMIAFQFIPPITILLFPLVLFLEFVLIVGLSLPLSILSVRYKDIVFIWKVVIQAGFFLTPIFYKIDMLPEPLQEILFYSPMVKIFTISRDLVLYGNLPSLDSIFIAIGTTLTVFVVGILIFKKFETKIIEEI